MSRFVRKGFGTRDVLVVHIVLRFGRTTPGPCWFILLVAEDEGLRYPQRGATCSSPDITGESGDLTIGLGDLAAAAHLFPLATGCYLAANNSENSHARGARFIAVAWLHKGGFGRSRL